MIRRDNGSVKGLLFFGIDFPQADAYTETSDWNCFKMNGQQRINLFQQESREGRESMNRDILYKEQDFVFSYRVGGVLIQDGRILLQKPDGEEYSIIGGHVSRLETTEKTLIREFEEEIHAAIEADELIAVGEIFFPWGKRPCHQIALYYRVHLKNRNDIPDSGVFCGYDDLDRQRINMTYCWVPLEELEKITVYPEELKAHIMSGMNGIVHFISDQL